MKYLENFAAAHQARARNAERHFLCDELPWSYQTKTLNTARAQADCTAMVVLAPVLMTDFIDWKIKSL